MKVKKCPFCGSRLIGFREINGGPGIGVDSYVIKCTVCRAEGPNATPIKEAVKKWNERYNEKS